MEFSPPVRLEQCGVTVSGDTILHDHSSFDYDDPSATV